MQSGKVIKNLTIGSAVSAAAFGKGLSPRIWLLSQSVKKGIHEQSQCDGSRGNWKITT